MNGSHRFKPYPAYKDSGVEWLGEIPAHWEVKRLKNLAVLNPEALAEDTDPALEMAYVDIGGVDNLGRIIGREQLTFAAAPSRARRLVRGGDVIVSTVRTYLRAIAPISEQESGTVVSTGFAVVRPEDDLRSDYAAYALRAPYFVERVVANSKGVSFPAINESEMATYEVATPPSNEQRAIAAFLDRETAKVDALVVKKERLIELLQEQRTAIITHAVTKGLDPNVPMKDSGIEWLGEIPVHWEEQRLGQLLKHRPRNGVSPTIGPYGATPTFSTAAVKDGVVAIDGNIKYTTIGTLEAEPFRVFKGDVLLLRGSGSRALVGRAGIVTNEPPEGCVYPDILIRLRPRVALTSWFLVSSLNSSAVRHQIELAAKTAAGIWKITGEDVQCLVIAVPPVPEQLQIEKWASYTTATIDALVAKVRDAIDRLKELRTALISAAVTGKIDVRDASVEASAGQGGVA